MYFPKNDVPMSGIKKLYIIGDTSKYLMKVGISGNTSRRVYEIRRAYPCDVDLLWERELGRSAAFIERIAHRMLEDRRIIAEWFRVSLPEAIDVVERAMVEWGDRAPVTRSPARSDFLVWAGGHLHKVKG